MKVRMVTVRMGLGKLVGQRAMGCGVVQLSLCSPGRHWYLAGHHATWLRLSGRASISSHGFEHRMKQPALTIQITRDMRHQIFFYGGGKLRKLFVQNRDRQHFC